MVNWHEKGHPHRAVPIPTNLCEECRSSGLLLERTHRQQNRVYKKSRIPIHVEREQTSGKNKDQFHEFAGFRSVVITSSNFSDLSTNCYLTSVAPQNVLTNQDWFLP